MEELSFGSFACAAEFPWQLQRRRLHFAQFAEEPFRIQRSGYQAGWFDIWLPSIVLPCTLRKSFAVLLRSALRIQAVPDGTGRKGGHGIPVPRHRREILDANGASSIRILGQGSGHLMGIVAATRILAVMHVGRVGPGRGTTLAPTGVLGAARPTLAKAAKEALDAPTVLAGGAPAVAGLLATHHSL